MHKLFMCTVLFSAFLHRKVFLPINFSRGTDLQTRSLLRKKTQFFLLANDIFITKELFSECGLCIFTDFRGYHKEFKGVYLVLTATLKVKFSWKNMIARNGQLVKSVNLSFLWFFQILLLKRINIYPSYTKKKILTCSQNSCHILLHDNPNKLIALNPLVSCINGAKVINSFQFPLCRCYYIEFKFFS